MTPDLVGDEDVTRDQTQDDDIPSQVVSMTASLAEQNLQSIMAKIDEEKQAQKELELKSERLKSEKDEVDRVKKMQETTFFGDKLMLLERRNIMPSAVNYATHCDF